MRPRFRGALEEKIAAGPAPIYADTRKQAQKRLKRPEIGPKSDENAPGAAVFRSRGRHKAQRGAELQLAAAALIQ